MNYVYLIGSLGMVGSALYYYQTDIKRYVMLNYIWPQIEYMAKLKSDNELKNDVMLKPVHQDSMHLQFQHEGKTHSIYLPWNESLIRKMQRRKVYLLKRNNVSQSDTNLSNTYTRIDISQKPGIPYLLSAKDLGGEKIIIEDLSGEIIGEFENEEIPKIN